MTRIFFTAFVLFAMTAPVWAAESGSDLTGKTLIEEENVTVGDLFTKSGKDAGYVLAPAPKAGEKLVLTKDDLLRVSTAFHLNWAPPAGNVYMTLERNATKITDDQIIAALDASELKHKVSSEAQFTLTSKDEISIPGKVTPDISIGHTNYDPTTELFDADLIVKKDGEVLRTVKIQGMAAAMATIPVVKYPLTSGNVIDADAVGEISVPKNQLRGDSVMNKADLVGMTVKRAIQANQIISQSDVIPPMMIKRNDMVSVIYRNGPIQLSTKARALNNASRGDVVQLINPTSKKAFEAKVTGPQQAEVSIEG